MSDLLRRLRELAECKHDDHDVATEAVGEIIDLNWRIVDLEEENAALNAFIEKFGTQTDAVHALRQENAALRERFAHYHRDSGVPGNDSCKECGFDLRNPIHTRAAWAEEQK